MIFLGVIVGSLIGWYSKQILDTLKSMRLQLIRILKKTNQGTDPLAGIRVQQVVTPKPPDQIIDEHDPYYG